MTLFYSQNSEDVLLARCFEGENQGFYVDVGAEDPVEGSITRHFYERGWNGINIEPVPFFFDRSFYHIMSCFIIINQKYVFIAFLNFWILKILFLNLFFVERNSRYKYAECATFTNFT